MNWCEESTAARLAAKKCLASCRDVEEIERRRVLSQPLEGHGRSVAEALLRVLGELVAEVRMSLAEELGAFALDEEAEAAPVGLDVQIERGPVAASPC